MYTRVETQTFDNHFCSNREVYVRDDHGSVKLSQKLTLIVQLVEMEKGNNCNLTHRV